MANHRSIYKSASIITLIIIVAGPVQSSINISKSRKLEQCRKDLTESSGGSTGCHRCAFLYQPKCLDIKLPYMTTTIPEYLSKYLPDVDLTKPEEVLKYLHSWENLKHLPKCWQDLQVTLCSLFMPECLEDKDGGRIRISKPNVDSCYDLVNNTHCKFIERHYSWNSIFNCSNTELYSRNCTNELRDLKLHSPAPTCKYPLVVSNNTNAWFKDVDGCSLHCKYPILDRHDQANISLFIRFMSLLGLAATSLAIGLFEIDESNTNRSQMARVIKRCNMCQFFLYVGWCLQIFLNYDIACSSSESALYGLPLVANACVLSFFLTYLPSLSTTIWCAYLGKLCHRTLISKTHADHAGLDRLFSLISKTHATTTKRSADHARLDGLFRLLGYGVPAALLVTVVFLGHIDGHGLYGICTVGQQSIVIKGVFVFLPTLVGTVYGNFYFLLTIKKLLLLEKIKPSLQRDLARIIALTCFSGMQLLLNIVNYFYSLHHQSEWKESIDQYLKCALKPEIETGQDCVHNMNPWVHLYYLELLPTLATGIVIASWAFKKSNFRALLSKPIFPQEDASQRKARLEADTPSQSDTSIACSTSLGNFLSASVLGSLPRGHSQSLTRPVVTEKRGQKNPTNLQNSNFNDPLPHTNHWADFISMLDSDSEKFTLQQTDHCDQTD